MFLVRKWGSINASSDDSGFITFLYWYLKNVDAGTFKKDLTHPVSQTSSICDYSPWHAQSAIAQSVQGSRRPGSAVSQSSSVGWNGSVGRRWIKPKLIVRKQIYDSIKQKVTNHTDEAKQAFYSAKVQSSTICKQFFQNFNTILGTNISSPPPSTFNSNNLPNVFSDYFTKKMCNIENNLPPPNPTACPDASFAGNPLLTFEPVTDDWICLKNNQVHLPSLVNWIPFPPHFFMKTLTYSCQLSQTSSTYHMI